jgi:hypothetical protein
MKSCNEIIHLNLNVMMMCYGLQNVPDNINRQSGNGSHVVLLPRDSYRQRYFVEPIGTYIVLRTGRLARLELDLAGRLLTLHLIPNGDAVTGNRTGRRLSKLRDCRQNLPFSQYLIQVAPVAKHIMEV